VNMESWSLQEYSHGPDQAVKISSAQNILHKQPWSVPATCKSTLHNIHNATLLVATGVIWHTRLQESRDFAMRCSMCVCNADMTHMLWSLEALPPKRPG